MLLCLFNIRQRQIMPIFLPTLRIPFHTSHFHIRTRMYRPTGYIYYRLTAHIYIPNPENFISSPASLTSSSIAIKSNDDWSNPCLRTNFLPAKRYWCEWVSLCRLARFGQYHNHFELTSDMWRKLYRCHVSIYLSM